MAMQSDNAVSGCTWQLMHNWRCRQADSRQQPQTSGKAGKTTVDISSNVPIWVLAPSVFFPLSYFAKSLVNLANEQIGLAMNG